MLTTLRAAAVLLAAATLAACGTFSSTNPQRTEGGDIVRALQNEGVTLHARGMATGSYVSQPGQEYMTSNGERVMIYEYQSTAAATLDASQLSGLDMNPSTPPHFFQKDNVIAVYLGNNPMVVTAFSNVLGTRLE